MPPGQMSQLETLIGQTPQWWQMGGLGGSLVLSSILTIFVHLEEADKLALETWRWPSARSRIIVMRVIMTNRLP